MSIVFTNIGIDKFEPHKIVVKSQKGMVNMFSAINLKKLLTSLIPPYAAGFLGWFFTRNSMDIYQKLISPPLSPPGFIFPIVWIILYTLMGIAFYIVREAHVRTAYRKSAYASFFLQLVFNFIWTLLFFRFGLYGFSAIWLGALIILIGINIYTFARINKTAAWLLVPYLIWCIFALYLNIGIFVLN